MRLSSTQTLDPCDGSEGSRPTCSLNQTYIVLPLQWSILYPTLHALPRCSQLAQMSCILPHSDPSVSPTGHRTLCVCVCVARRWGDGKGIQCMLPHFLPSTVLKYMHEGSCSKADLQGLQWCIIQTIVPEIPSPPSGPRKSWYRGLKYPAYQTA